MLGLDQRQASHTDSGQHVGSRHACLYAHKRHRDKMPSDSTWSVVREVWRCICAQCTPPTVGFGGAGIQVHVSNLHTAQSYGEQQQENRRYRQDEKHASKYTPDTNRSTQIDRNVHMREWLRLTLLRLTHPANAGKTRATHVSEH